MASSIDMPTTSDDSGDISEGQETGPGEGCGGRASIAGGDIDHSRLPPNGHRTMDVELMTKANPTATTGESGSRPGVAKPESQRPG
ncbi:hypothetical protein ACLKA7_016677 [Drosophila subpalustris]